MGQPIDGGIDSDSALSHRGDAELVNRPSELNYKINKQRQQIVDSWPNYIDDSNAKNDWNWKPQYNFDLAFNKYIKPELMNSNNE